MVITKEVLLSKEGYEELTLRLDELKNVKRGEVAEKIKTAREFGDLSENAEYDEAKQEQGFIEMEIRELEEKLKNAVIIDSSSISKDRVSVGTKVKVYDLDFEEEEVYSIVGSEEVDLVENKISNESPMGQALIGATVGQEVAFNAPAGEIKLKVIEII